MPGQIFVITVRPRVFWPATRLSWPHGLARFRSDRGCCIVKQRPAGEGQVCCSVCMMADGSVLLRDVTVRYGRHIALEAVSGEFAAGSLTAVVGANGAGKSTPPCGNRRRSAAGARGGRLSRAPAPGLSATARRDRPRLSADSVRTDHARRMAGVRCVPRSPSVALRVRAAAAAETVGLAGRLGRPHWRTFGGRVAAGTVRSADRAGRRGYPARRTVRGGRCADHVRPARSDHAMAPGGPDGHRRAA